MDNNSFKADTEEGSSISDDSDDNQIASGTIDENINSNNNNNKQKEDYNVFFFLKHFFLSVSNFNFMKKILRTIDKIIECL